MSISKNLSLLTLLAAVTTAAPGLAAADHRRDTGWMQLAEVGTHAHDAEDFVSVDPRLNVQRVQLRSTQGFVPVDGLRVHFTDGRTIYADVHRGLRQGQSVIVELPDGPIDMLTIDYGNQGPYWRALETAHLQVNALASNGRAGRDRGDRFRDQRDYRDYRDQRDYRDYRSGDARDHRTYRDDRVRTQPYIGPAPAQQPVYEWRGGVQVRIR